MRHLFVVPQNPKTPFTRVLYLLWIKLCVTFSSLLSHSTDTLLFRSRAIVLSRRAGTKIRRWTKASSLMIPTLVTKTEVSWVPRKNQNWTSYSVLTSNKVWTRPALSSMYLSTPYKQLTKSKSKGFWGSISKICRYSKETRKGSLWKSSRQSTLVIVCLKSLSKMTTAVDLKSWFRQMMSSSLWR